MCEGDSLYPIQNIIQKTFQPSLSFTLNFWHKKLHLISITLNIILCTIDVVGLYPNIPHDEGLIALRKSLESKQDKTISTNSLMDLAVCLLKSNICEHNFSFP